MALQEDPICFWVRCTERVDHDPVFEAPCGHEECPSAVFHPLCLMQWREHRENIEREIKRFIAQHQAPDEHPN